MTTKDRLKEFLSYKKIGRNKFETKLGLASGYMSSKGITITSEVIEKTSSEYPELNLDWLITGKGEMLKSTAENKPMPVINDKPTETRPRIPYTASAGCLTSAVEGVTPDQCEQIPRIVAFPNYDFTIIIKGNSMEPKYEGGDEVACKRVDSTTFIQWGKVHVMDTSQGIVIKRVYEDGDKIRCVSYNPEYPDFSISKDEIYSMSLVVGLLRM